MIAIFCHLPEERIYLENEKWIAIKDGYPVTEGHTLLIPKRHSANYFGLAYVEYFSLKSFMVFVIKNLKDEYPEVNDWNIGMNCGEYAGQTVFHTHIHLIPRREGDVENPKGGVRHLIPGKGDY